MARVLIGGVGYRWFGDASFGLVVADTLASHAWPPGIHVADLGYGALWVVQELGDADPPYDRVVLLGAAVRGRVPGQLYQSRWNGLLPHADEIQALIREAGAGIIELHHLLVIGRHFDALPPDVVVVEFEPADMSGGAALSAAAQARVEEAAALARAAALAPA